MQSTRKPGRPTEANAKRKRIDIRVSDAEAERLDRCAAELGKTRSETLLYGLMLVETELKEDK